MPGYEIFYNNTFVYRVRRGDWSEMDVSELSGLAMGTIVFEEDGTTPADASNVSVKELSESEYNASIQSQKLSDAIPTYDGNGESRQSWESKYTLMKSDG